MARALSQLDTKKGDAGDAWSAAIEFDFATRAITAECWDEALDLQLSYDGTNWEDTMEIDPDRAWALPFQALSFRVKNTTPGSTARYEIRGGE